MINKLAITLFLTMCLVSVNCYMPPFHEPGQRPLDLTYKASPQPGFWDHVTGKQNDLFFNKLAHLVDNQGNKYSLPNTNPDPIHRPYIEPLQLNCYILL